MPLTKSNYDLPDRNQVEISEKIKKQQKRLEFENKSLDQTLNALTMASPFSVEEKQILLETVNTNSRKAKLEKILNTYIVDEFSNTTIQ